MLEKEPYAVIRILWPVKFRIEDPLVSQEGRRTLGLEEIFSPVKDGSSVGSLLAGLSWLRLVADWP